MDGLPTDRQIDHVALFKEINELVSFHDLLEPLSPYSSDSDSSSSFDCLTEFSDRLLSTPRARVKKYKTRGRYPNRDKLEDPSEDRLFQMLAKGTRKKTRDSSLSKHNSSVIDTERDSPKINIGGSNGTIKETQEESKGCRMQPPLNGELTSNASSLSSARKAAICKFKSLQITERSYFKNTDKGLSKYPNYFEYVDTFKKPIKQLEAMLSSSSNQNSSTEIDGFMSSQVPDNSDLNPDILSTLNSILFSSD